MAGAEEQSETGLVLEEGTRSSALGWMEGAVRDSVLVNPNSAAVRKPAKRPIWSSDLQPRPRLIELCAYTLCRP